MQGQKPTVRLSVGHSNGSVHASDKARGINTLSVVALTEDERRQEGEIDRFKGCSQLDSRSSTISMLALRISERPIIVLGPFGGRGPIAPLRISSPRPASP